MPLAGSAAKDWRRCPATLTRFSRWTLASTPSPESTCLTVCASISAYGDIAHIRPSGDAPQLRIYAVERVEARADRIVDLALDEPDGILRRLERAFT